MIQRNLGGQTGPIHNLEKGRAAGSHKILQPYRNNLTWSTKLYLKLLIAINMLNVKVGNYRNSNEVHWLGEYDTVIAGYHRSKNNNK